MKQIAQEINILGTFCGRRDIAELTTEALQKRYGIAKADVMVLFGGSVLAGGDVLAEAIRNDVAERYVIVGGAGHTTQTLREIVHAECPKIAVAGKTEAEIFQEYVKTRYGCQADYLEMRSTNCGNNITYLLELLEEKNVPFRSIILCQDATMQNRMDAVMRKFVPDDVTIINFASYQVEVAAEGERLFYKEAVHGMWKMERYINLLMGEIPRLTDDADGYGPAGRDYLAHVDIPEKVTEAFAHLKTVYGNLIREANPLYASVEEREKKE